MGEQRTESDIGSDPNMSRRQTASTRYRLNAKMIPAPVSRRLQKRWISRSSVIRCSYTTNARIQTGGMSKSSVSTLRVGSAQQAYRAMPVGSYLPLYCVNAETIC